MSRVLARFLVLSFSSDWLYPPADSAALTAALGANGKDVQNVVIPSSYGHDAFLVESEAVGKLVRQTLELAATEAVRGVRP